MDDTKSPRWRVKLEGDDLDVGHLLKRFTAPELRVVRTEGEGASWLESSTFDGYEDQVKVREAAIQLVERINGAARLKWRRHRNVIVGSELEKLTDEGVQRHTIVAVDTIEVRARVMPVTVVVGDEVPAPAEPGSLDTDRWLELAGRDSDVDEALLLWGSKPNDWVNLYKVYEIVRRRADIVRSGWATRTQVDRFTRTANDPVGGGADARHARSRAQPSPNPMSREEGTDLIGRILERWLDSLIPP
jgi:hypothetical protein